ncbi:MAG: DUF3459 domain-containing protein, partial [Nitrococcus sp.]|nr:DUF3459 domain-containing protein [Nitrococcus sp.]
PDPTAEDTFLSAKLAWEDRARSPHSQRLTWYRNILQLRRAEIVPRLARVPGRAGEYETFADSCVRVRWRLGDNSRLTLTANLSRERVRTDGPIAGRVLWREGEPADGSGRLGPWSVIWSIEEATSTRAPNASRS